MEQQALKIDEAKKVASGKFEWHTLKNGVQGYVYWFDKRTNILYGQTPDGQYPQAFNIKTGVRTYLTPAQMKAIGENAQDPEKEKQKISEAKTQAVDTWNFELNSALVDKQSGKKFGYYFDSKEGVVYATDPSRSTFFYWDEDKSDWSKILLKDISDDATAGLEQAKVEVSRNKPSKLGGTGPRENPTSKIRKSLSELIAVRKEGNKETQKDFVTKLFKGEFKDVFNALDEGDEEVLKAELKKLRVPEDPQLILQLKQAFPEGSYAKLMQ
jgi:hypothetical protein